MLQRTFLIIAAIVALNFSFWSLTNPTADERPWGGLINGLSYTPSRESLVVGEGKHADAAEIDANLALLADHASSVRTYGTNGGQELVPRLAARHGLRVTLGIWIGNDLAATDAPDWDKHN